MHLLSFTRSSSNWVDFHITVKHSSALPRWSIVTRNFKEGGLYFILSYLDEDLVYPKIETLIYVGRTLDGKEKCSWLFQDVESYYYLGSFNDEEGDYEQELEEGVSPQGKMIGFMEDDLENILTLKELIPELETHYKL